MGVSTLEVKSPVSGQIRKLSFAETLRMSDAGILDPRERVELVDGVLVTMSPESLLHVLVVRSINGLMSLHYPWPNYEIRVQTTFPLGEYHYRVPDLAIARRVDQWLTPTDLVLMVEVAQTNLTRDLVEKAAAYAGWGASTFWVVDIPQRRVVVFSDRGPHRYETVRTVEAAGLLDLPGIGSRLAVADILPTPPETVQ